MRSSIRTYRIKRGDNVVKIQISVEAEEELVAVMNVLEPLLRIKRKRVRAPEPDPADKYRRVWITIPILPEDLVAYSDNR